MGTDAYLLGMAILDPELTLDHLATAERRSRLGRDGRGG